MDERQGAVMTASSAHPAAARYVALETTMSGLVNGVLNLAAAYALFHAQAPIPATSGPHSLLRDSIGETFLVVALSMLVPSLITRNRRKAGVLPAVTDGQTHRAGNLYLEALALGLIFTVLGVSLNAVLLPRIFPHGVSLANVILFKTFYGVIFGAIATYIGLRRSLHEVD